MDCAQVTNEKGDIHEEEHRSSCSMKSMMLFFLTNKVKMYQSMHDTVETKLSKDYLHENVGRVLFFFIYLAISIGLFIYVVIYRVHQHIHWLEVIARICGMQLNFNSMLMIVLMLRHTARLIRISRFLHTFIPLDDTISIHKMVGRWIVILVFIHALCHMIYFGLGEHGK